MKGPQAPSYEDLKARLAEAETALGAIRNEKVDALIGAKGVYLLRLKELEEALRESEQKFRNSFVDAAVGFALTTPRGGFVEVNPAYCRITGYDEEDLKNLTEGRLIHPDDAPRHSARMELLLSGRKTHFVGENRYVRKDGSSIWVRNSVSLIAGTDGVPAWIVTLVEDISLRRQAEDKSHRAMMMSQALNRINDALHVTLDFDEVARRAVVEGAGALGSESAALSLRQDDGWTVWHVHGMSTSLVGSRMQDREEQHAPEALRSRRPIAIADTHNDDRFNGEHLRRHNIRAVLVVPLIVHGRPFGVIFFNYHTEPHTFTETETSFARQLAATASIALENARLFSRLQDAHRELGRARDELESRVRQRTFELEERSFQLARLTSQLVLSEHRERRRFVEILHDHLQQLLVTAKMGQESLLQHHDKSSEPEAARVLSLINQSIKVSRSLCAELSPAILDSGDLTASLEWLVRWMGENQEFQVELEADAWVVLGRKDLTVLVFESVRELLFNVLKHAGVKRAAVKMEQTDGELLISVRDQGVGFAPDSAWKKGVAGEGFGLFAVRERLRHLGGRLVVESAPHTGTCVSLRVPLGGRRHEPMETEPAHVFDKIAPNPAPQSNENGTFGSKKRLLLVDDHPVVRQGLHKTLGRHTDIEIVGHASDGMEAVQLVRKLVPDVILMDVNMPRMNGLEATRIIHTEFPHIRIVALSMYTEEEQADAMVRAGASAYRSKSDRTDLLLEAIREE